MQLQNCLATIRSKRVFGRAACGSYVFLFRRINMSNLSTQKPTFDLKKYLHDVYELEKQKYLLEERVEILEIEKEGEELEYNNHIEFDTIPTFEKSQYYQNWSNEFKQYNNQVDQSVNIYQPDKITGKLVAILAVVGFFIGAFTGCSATFSSRSGIVIWPVFVFTIIGAVVGGIIGSAIDANRNKNYENQYNSIMQETNNTNQRIKAENAKKQSYNNERYYYWKSKYEEEEKQKKCQWEKRKLVYTNYCDKEIAVINPEIQKLDSALESIYNLEIDGKLCLHPAYRGLSPVAVIYGYLDTGRCTELEGHEGAYNIYEQEKRLGYIIDKLDVISNKLDQLNGTMMYLGQAIYQCNDKLDQLNENSMKTLQAIEYMNIDIVDGMDKLTKGMDSVTGNLSGISQSLSYIEVNSANSAYYAKVGSEAATYTAYYNMLKN